MDRIFLPDSYFSLAFFIFSFKMQMVQFANWELYEN